MNRVCVQLLTTKRVTQHTRAQNPGLVSTSPSPSRRNPMSTSSPAPPAVGAALLIGAAGLSACGANDADRAATTPATAAATADDRAAAARVEDHPLRGLRQAALRGQGRRAVRRLRGRLLQRRPGRGQAGPAGRHRHLRGRRASSCSTRSTARAPAAWCRPRRTPAPRSSPTTGSSRRPTTTCPSTTRRSARCRPQALVDAMGDKGSILMLNGCARRPQRRAVQGRRAQRPRRQRRRRSSRSTTTPTGAPRTRRSSSPTSSSKYDAAEINGVYAANDGQAGGVVAALTGGGVAADALPPDHRPGRRARRDPADHRRRAGDDDLQADPDRGRDGRRGRGRARQR